MKIKLVYIVLVLIVFSFPFLFAKNNTEKILLCDFETEEHMGYFPSSEGMSATTKIVHEPEKVKVGKGAYEMSWDFTKVSEGFLNFDFYKDTPGIIESVSLWIYADKNSVNSSVNIWTEDQSGEFYFASCPVKEVGWQHVTCPVSKSVPWASGDKNEIQNPPMKFMTICVNVANSPEKGTLIVDQIEAEVSVGEETEGEQETVTEIDEDDLESEQVWLSCEDYENIHTINGYTTNPSFYLSSKIEKKNVHSGKNAADISWKFTPESDSGYNVYYVNKTAPGKIKQIEFWAYLEEDTKCRMTSWVLDETQEMYVGSIILDKEGWNKYTLDISETSPWDSGDKNKIQDGNMSLNALLIERRDSSVSGNVIIDDIKFLVEAPFTHFISQNMSVTGDEFWKIWANKGTLNFSTTNNSQRDFKNLSYKISVKDTNTDKIVKTQIIKTFPLKSQGKAEKSVFLELPYSHYEVTSELYMGSRLIGTKTYPLTFFKGKCGVNTPQGKENYLFKCGYFGGVTWEALPSFLRDAGCRWTRGFRDDWKGIEYEKDKFNTDKLINSVKEYREAGIDHILLMCTYNQPSWREYANLDFAPGYGRVHEAIAKEGVIDKYELGNEDNSSHTKTYAEVGRNGAAGIRKYDSKALISGSATAGIDKYFFNVQKEKGLLDRLDLIIVHPYCNNNNPEDFGMFDNSLGMIDMIDSLGGYKNLWSTEYGYNDGTEGPSVLSDKIRSEYYVRHSLLQTAANYERVGMFAWNYYWGIFEQSHGTLRALSVATMTKQLEGYRFAGALSLGPKLWVLVYEKLGENPIAVCWTNKDTEMFDLGSGLSYYDMYNNKIAKFDSFSEEPVYVHGISDDLLVKAWNFDIERELARVNKEGGLSLSAETSMDDMWQSLVFLGDKMKSSHHSDIQGVKLSEETKLNNSISAASFHLLKAMFIKGRYTDFVFDYDISDFRDTVINYLEEARKQDKDYPKTRWAFHEFEKLEAERLYAIEEKRDDFANKLFNCEKVLAKWTKDYLMNDSDLRQNQVWAYLYDLDGTKLKEKLTFVPDVATRVKVRVSNYAINPQVAKITLDLPEGWTCAPEIQTINLSPGEDATTYFDITAKETERTKDLSVTTKTDIGTGVVGTATFTDIELISQISVAQMASHGIHPKAPMEFAVRNSSSLVKNGTIKVYSKDKLVGEGTFEGLEPKTKKIYKVDLKETPSDLDNMKVVVSGEGFKDAQQNFKTEYCFAPKNESINIDSAKNDMNKYPLFIDKEEYDWGSFMGSWTPNDLSATSYFAWDKDYLYFRCLVNDNVFYQVSKGDDTFMYDSVQIDIMNKDKRITQLCLAHMGDNLDQVYMYRGPVIGKMTDIPCKITVDKDKTDYIVAIPWKYIIDNEPQAGDDFKIEVLINDHDITAPRRVLERFSDGIYHATAITDDYGVLVLGE